LSFVDATSTSGNLEVSEVDGRQKIVYTIPPGEFEDTISFRFNISWMYIFMQFWIYPVTFLLILLLVGRKINKRRKRKKAVKKAKSSRDAAEMKGTLGNDEFADLAGFHSPAIHGDQEIFQTYNADIDLDDKPLSYVDEQGRFS
jgi:flagellar biosynthesis/type III secretory pathway M-ring protein FliF/YscJ